MRYRGTPSDEPLTIDAKGIAAYLDQLRKPEMADFVRHLGSAVAEANQRAEGYFRHANALAKRLEALDPRDKPHDPTPPAEASD